VVMVDKTVFIGSDQKTVDALKAVLEKKWGFEVVNHTSR
jgi:hypothetical protein